MAYWRLPVFDRTQEDVDRAIKQISEWIASSLSGKPIVVSDLKGCLKVADINRIEGNIAYLSERLNEYYYVADTPSKTWDRGGLPTKYDVERILRNIRELREVFCVHPNAPSVPSSMLRYDDVNAVELNLELIKELLEKMIECLYKKSGNFNSGCTFFLPIRR
jgi:hypothetical protein